MSYALVAPALGLGLGSWATQSMDAYRHTDWLGVWLLGGCAAISLAAIGVNLAHMARSFD